MQEYLHYIKNNNKFRTTYKIAACEGIVHYLLATLITILIVAAFKPTLSIKLITTIFFICLIISVYIFQYKLKSNPKILEVSSIAMILSLFLLLLDINKITIIIYNLYNSVFLVLLMNTAKTKSYDMINEDKKAIEDYIAYHQIIWKIILNVARILGCLVLFISSLFNNMITIYK